MWKGRCLCMFKSRAGSALLSLLTDRYQQRYVWAPKNIALNFRLCSKYKLFWMTWTFYKESRIFHLGPTSINVYIMSFGQLWQNSEYEVIFKLFRKMIDRELWIQKWKLFFMLYGQLYRDSIHGVKCKWSKIDFNVDSSPKTVKHHFNVDFDTWYFAPKEKITKNGPKNDQKMTKLHFFTTSLVVYTNWMQISSSRFRDTSKFIFDFPTFPCISLIFWHKSWQNIIFSRFLRFREYQRQYFFYSLPWNVYLIATIFLCWMCELKEYILLSNRRKYLIKLIKMFFWGENWKKSNISEPVFY